MQQGKSTSKGLFIEEAMVAASFQASTKLDDLKKLDSKPRRRMTAKIGLKASRPWASVLMVGAAYGLYISLRLWMVAWDASVFIEAGDHYVNAGRTPEDIYVESSSDGYDGQFYYRLALDPLSNSKEIFGVTLDKPQYREQRILYPLTVRLVTFGNPQLVPEGLILVNLLAMLSLAFFGTALLSNKTGALPIWSIPLYPGFLLSLSRDLAEPLAIALVLGSLLALKRQRNFLSTSLLALAVLTRETTLLVPIAGALVWAWDRLRKREEPELDRVAWHFWVFPLVVWSGWQSLLFLRSGVLPVISGGNNIGWPLYGLLQSWSSVGQQDLVIRVRWLLEVGLIASVVLAALISVRRSSATAVEKVALVGYALLVVMLSSVVWVEDWAFLRAASELFLFAFIVLALARSRLTTWIGGASIGLWVVLAWVNIS